MKKMAKYFSLLLVPIMAFSCARKVTNPNSNKVLQFTLKVKGKMILDNPNITYYVVFYAPRTLTPDTTIVDTNIGPRINTPSLTQSNSFLQGRLPFIDALPGDQPSKWTDFYYITSVNGRTVVGKGKIDDKGIPLIETRDYQNQNTKPITTNNVVNGYQIELFLESLNANQANIDNKQASLVNTIVANVATSDNIDSGRGDIYDYWNNNTPFSITTAESQSSAPDNTSSPSLKKTPNNPNPTLPFGINPDDVNIVEYSYKVTQ